MKEDRLLKNKIYRQKDRKRYRKIDLKKKMLTCGAGQMENSSLDFFP